jgi:uncharacterized protein (TIGR03083 family)
MEGLLPAEGLLDRLRAANAWYLEGVDALGETGWGKASRCAGWTGANVVAHVTGGDYFIRAVIFDATGHDPSLLAGLPSDMAGRVKRAQAMAAWEPARLRAETRKQSQQTVTALGEVVARAPQTMLRMPFWAELSVSQAATLRAVEYIVHGYDLEPATGRARPVPEWFIANALPRAAQTMPRTHERSPHKGRAASFHLHRTDGEGEWILRAEGGRARCEPGHSRADVALRGPAAGLYWVLMGRGSPADHGVEVHGDPQLAAAFKEWFPGP